MKVTDGVNTEETEDVDETTKNNEDEVKETKESVKNEEKKYTDEEVNAISLKNQDKAINKIFKELGVANLEEAKAKLSQEEPKEEKDNSQEEELKTIAEKATVEAINLRIENALLLKGIDSNKAIRAKRLIDKKNLLNDSGEVEEEKLTLKFIEALMVLWNLLSLQVLV